jgi:hypothetical protein
VKESNMIVSKSSVIEFLNDLFRDHAWWHMLGPKFWSQKGDQERSHIQMENDLCSWVP